MISSLLKVSLSSYICLVFILCHLGVAIAMPIYSIQNDVADLATFDFSDDIVPLKGDVAFYWEEFISYGEFSKYEAKRRTLSLSHSWDHQSAGYESFPRNGYATYHFQVTIPEDAVGELFIIRPYRFIAYASRVMVNGVVVCDNGTVGRSKYNSSYSPSANMNSRSFIADSETLDVVIWASNYDHFKGGIICNMELGLAEHMLKKREKSVVHDLMVVICLFSMFCYHIILYLINKENTIALFFSLMCLDFALDFSFQNAMVFFVFFPDVHFETILPFQLSLHYLIPPTAWMFFYALYPNEVPKQLRNLSVFIAFVIISIVFTTDSSIYSHLFKPHLIYICVSEVYVFYLMFKALRNKRSGIYFFIGSVVIVFICGLFDMLEIYEVLEYKSLFAPGFKFFMFFLSYLQGFRHEEIYRNNLRLNKELRLLNIGIEHQVEQRTNDLVVANMKLKELASFKEDMTNMIIHDLKMPLSTVINVKRFTNDFGLTLVKQAGYEILNLVQNVLAVYKYDNTKIELNIVTLESLHLIESAIKDIHVLAEQKSLIMDYDKENSYSISADRDYIKRVLVNLLSNAVKYAPMRSSIKIVFCKDEKHELTVSVCNTGPQIPRDKQLTIFERFGQDNGQPAKEISSIGLGLAFCKIAVEAHGGSIGVESTAALTRFYFVLLPSIEDTKRCLTSKAEGLKDIRFSTANQHYLQRLVTRFSQYKVYHASQLRLLISEIDTSDNQIMMWKREMEKAVYTCDKDLFEKLLLITNTNK